MIKIQYRHVINDACVGPWGDWDEFGPFETIQQAIDRVERELAGNIFDVSLGGTGLYELENHQNTQYRFKEIENAEITIQYRRNANDWWKDWHQLGTFQTREAAIDRLKGEMTQEIIEEFGVFYAMSTRHQFRLQGGISDWKIGLNEILK